MKAAWLTLGIVLLLAALVWVEHRITKVEAEANDAIDALLDAVLDRPATGVWVTPNDDLAMWDAEMHDHFGGAA